MNALIIVAIALVAVGLLVTVVLWLRTPDSAESEYVTVAELRARLEHEQEPGEQAEGSDDRNPMESGESAPEPEKPATEADNDSATAATPVTSTHPETATPAAGESSTGTDDEPEVSGGPIRKSGEGEARE